MTKEEVMSLDMEQLEERAAEIAEETREAEPEMLETIEKELDSIEERKAIIKAEAEEKRMKMEEVLEKAEVIEEVKEERKPMTDKEIRSTEAYEVAWAEYIKGNKKAEEVRALLSDNVQSGGSVPVPTYVEERINTSWQADGIMSKVRKTFYKGNLKVATEVSASPAGFHYEGSEDTISEEVLNIVTQTLTPVTVKKWITISDEVWNDYTGREFADYILDEIEYQIVKAAGSEILNAVSDAVTAGVLTGNYNVSAPAITDIVMAMGTLSGDATDMVFIANRATIAAYQALALTANYGVDPFAGATPIAVDWLKPFNTTDEDDVFAIVGDLSSIVYNFPNGDQPTFKIDDLSMAQLDMVNVVGRMPIAAGYTKMYGLAYLNKDEVSA